MGNQNSAVGYFFITVADKTWGKNGFHWCAMLGGSLGEKQGMP